MTIEIAAWWIPTTITLVLLIGAIIGGEINSDAYGMGTIILLVPAMFLSMIAWIVYAVMGG